ncbi:MAG: hypothetical protein C0467_27050 [Planctomycetaceae bacterium]|nr:hypothetical protein [Planctomycetaceae bacterium]
MASRDRTPEFAQKDAACIWKCSLGPIWLRCEKKSRRQLSRKHQPLDTIVIWRWFPSDLGTDTVMLSDGSVTTLMPARTLSLDCPRGVGIDNTPWPLMRGNRP